MKGQTQPQAEGEGAKRAERVADLVLWYRCRVCNGINAGSFFLTESEVVRHFIGERLVAAKSMSRLNWSMDQIIQRFEMYSENFIREKLSENPTIVMRCGHPSEHIEADELSVMDLVSGSVKGFRYRGKEPEE